MVRGVAGAGGALAVGAAILAIALPFLIARNVSPSATFFNQAAAFLGWGLLLIVVAQGLPDRWWRPSRGTWALLAALIVLAVAAVASSAPWPLALSASGTIVAALLAAAVGAAAARAGRGEQAFVAVCVALVVAGVGSSLVGLIQVFAPNLADGTWIAPSGGGRATGNIRQPNQLSSQMLWSVVAAIWLGERRPVWREGMWLLSLLFIEVVVLTASRTGLVGMFVLAGWGLLDRRLSRATRLVLVCAPLAYGVLWSGTAMLAQASQQSFEAGSRIRASGFFASQSRFGIWANSLELIAMRPWLGVGFGEFNFAWTLTPFPGRPTEFFDHAHNLPLHFAVELGVPLALAVLGLLGYALWLASRRAVADGRGPGAVTSRLFERGEAAGGAPMQRAAFVFVVMIALHSMLEYPLWYSYFLLPTAFVFGLCLERPEAPAAAGVAGSAGQVTRPLVIASMLLVLGGTLAIYDFLRVVAVFDPAAPVALDQRIAQGRGSVLFGHHGDYAQATIADRPGVVIDAFRRPTHYLLDTRLMMAWTRALAETGEVDKARHLAARMKEFRSADAQELFAPCDPANARLANVAKLPFQCWPLQRSYRFENFR